MKRYLPFLILVLIFLVIKLQGFGIRLSDSNVYFYTAFQLIEGNLLYKDIFFTNFPLLPYISAFYYLILFGNLKLYMLTPAVEVIITSGILYYITLSHKKSPLPASMVSGSYLFSFIVLSTSDHQSGVFLASLFATLSYMFLLKKRFTLSGICLGLMIMVKAYFLPILLALLIPVFLYQRKHIVTYLISILVTILIVLLPSLLFAREEMFSNIVSYSLTRSQGISKLNILRFFTIHDPLLVILFIYSVIRFKKNLFAFLISVFGLLFIIFYQDIYYLYLNFLVPFLFLSLSEFSTSITKRFSINQFILPTIIIILALINVGIYLTSYQSLQRLHNVSSLVSALKQHPATFLYGKNTITPALAYLTEKQMLGGIVDTNENIFRKGYLNSQKLTKEAIAQNAILVSEGAYYPQYNINQPIISEIFDIEQIASSCSQIGSFPITTEGVENRLNFFECSLADE